MDEHECSGKIAKGLKDLGVLPGDAVLVHSSFKSLGYVPGGMETVIQGFLNAIGTDGTLLFPALSLGLGSTDIFDVRLTPSNVGAMPEYFRTREGVSRSVHPTHSVCALGRRASELLDDHILDSTPCGGNSPFHKLAETNGKIVMLGCGLKPNTTMHALEEYVEPPYLFGPVRSYAIRDHQRAAFQKEYRTHNFKGYEQRYDKVMELDTGSFLRKGQALQAITYVLDAPNLKRAVLNKMKSDVCFFVEEIPQKQA